MARRTFLVGSSLVAGGVAFGIYTIRKPHKNPLKEDLKEGEVTFNPWVKIGRDGIVLVAPHTDLGQGIRSLQAALIAEELDVELDQCTVVPGGVAGAYWNTAMANELVPFMSRDRSFTAESMRTVVTNLSKLMGLQGTGGSSAATDSYEKLRVAGAVARETLKLAAAHREDVDPQQLTTAKGTVVFPGGKRIRYTELAEEAAQIDPVTQVALREPSDWKYIGKDMLRLDIVAKSTGTLNYGIDLNKEGMLHATVRVNPRIGGNLKNFDASVAEKMPGVKHVFEVTNGIAVVATNTWSAFQAAKKVDCEWGATPFVPEMDDHWEQVNTSFTEEYLDCEWRNEGDISSSLADTDSVKSYEYRAPYLAHAPLEPIGAMVLVKNNRADIWATHQIPAIAEQLAAKIVGLSTEQVHLHNQYVGGSFGHRLEFENIKYAMEVAVKLKGVPIKLTYSREEDLTHDFPRQIGMAKVKGAVANKKIASLDLQIATPSAAASQGKRANLPPISPDGQIAAGAWNTPYVIPNFRVRAYRVPEIMPTSSWRSVGASTAGFFWESAVDELIHEAGADPLKERLRMCNYPLATRVLETVGEMSNWGSSLGDNQGRGVAMVISFGVPIAEVVEVTSTPKGIRIDKAFVAAEVGKVLDPKNFDNLVKGGVIWGLGHAMNCEITYSDGQVQQTNYHRFEAMRLYQCPEIEVRGLENGDNILGIGEPPVAPAAPALANAIFAATGQRLREMPFNKSVAFV